MAAIDVAKQLTSLKYDPQQAAIANRLQMIGATTQGNIDAINNVYAPKGQQYIGGVYDTLDSQLAANKANAMQQLDIAGNQIGQGYRDAVTLNNAARDESRQYLSNLASGMGAEQYGAGVSSALEQLVNTLNDRNRTSDATVTGNLRNWSAQQGSIYDQQTGMGKQMRAQSLSDFQNEILKAISQAQLQGSQQETTWDQQLAQILGERGSFLAETAQQLGQQDWENAFKQAQLQQQADQANADLALRGRQGDQDLAYKYATLAQQRAAQEAAQRDDSWNQMMDLLNFGQSSRQQDIENARFGQPSISDQLGLMGLGFNGVVDDEGNVRYPMNDPGFQDFARRIGGFSNFFPTTGTTGLSSPAGPASPASPAGASSGNGSLEEFLRRYGSPTGTTTLPRIQRGMSSKGGSF